MSNTQTRTHTYLPNLCLLAWKDTQTHTHTEKCILTSTHYIVITYLHKSNDLFVCCYFLRIMSFAFCRLNTLIIQFCILLQSNYDKCCSTNCLFFWMLTNWLTDGVTDCLDDDNLTSLVDYQMWEEFVLASNYRSLPLFVFSLNAFVVFLLATHKHTYAHTH